MQTERVAHRLTCCVVLTVVLIDVYVVSLIFIFGIHNVSVVIPSWESC